MRIRILLIIGFLSLTNCLDLSAQDDLFIHNISFTGNDSLSKESLLKQMSTTPITLTQKLKFWEKRTHFSSYSFEDDIIKLKNYYQKNGFLSPVISYQLIPDSRKKKLDIKLNIKEGPVVLISKIQYKLPIDTNSQQSLDSIKKNIPIKSAKRFRDEDVIAAEKIIYNYFSRKGYPFIRVNSNITLNESKQTADVEFDIKPGNKSYIGEINLRGDSLISTSYINKYIKIKENETFSQAKLEKTQKELFELSLFKYVTIRAIEDSVKNDKIPIFIHVKELPRWSLKTGVGYGTEDKIRVSMLLKRLNFLGGGRTLIVKGSHSHFNPLDLEVKFIQPNIWTKNMDFILNPFFSREEEDSYEVDRWGTSLTLQKVFTKKTSAYFSYTYGKDKVDLTNEELTADDIDIDDLNNTKSGITIGYKKSDINNLFSPTKGFKFSGMATYMGLGFNSELHYYKLMAEVSYYHSLSKKVVFASKLKSGIMEPTHGDLQTPIEDRFLMGGASSLRGWGRHQISPVDEEGNKLGGNSMLESSLELRFPLFGIFTGVSFMDFGNVWSDSWNLELGDLHYDAGLGLRVKTPVGPIRLDVATPVFKDKFSAQFFITIGHAF
ncbi:outer membrane protein assembly factor BamA [Ancylomarina sp. 16SWW S1-10-2]|uniref:outer membrane protein assembly factor BamA n=1 Tax=Ancylomarina sp. 16SWW S1-10-2 TaxID=2499681 RepID=UPI0012AD24BB|nr:outer membrane protein assembly factor BamA [Ancylomarina sp. 16SWW S1-10-2]MRT93936.1 outer membrane protein assembly factor BamA [Ancylomarina sp. 16SWW S1-10-2]